MKVTEYTERMREILFRSGLPSSEIDFRIGRLKDAERQPGSQISRISDAYYSLAHEIKALQFCLLWGMFVLRMIAIVGPDAIMF